MDTDKHGWGMLLKRHNHEAFANFAFSLKPFNGLTVRVYPCPSVSIRGK